MRNQGCIQTLGFYLYTKTFQPSIYIAVRLIQVFGPHVSVCLCMRSMGENHS